MSAEVGVLLASLRPRVVDMLLTRQRCAGGERLDCARGTKNKRCGQLDDTRRWQHDLRQVRRARSTRTAGCVGGARCGGEPGRRRGMRGGWGGCRGDDCSSG